MIAISVLAKIGKKDNTPEITILDSRPKPNHSTNSGASAIFGTSCRMMMKGLNAHSSGWNFAIAVPATTPAIIGQSRRASTTCC